MHRLFLICIVSFLSCSCGTSVTRETPSSSPGAAERATLSFTVVNLFPHDTSSFTEGFLVHEGQLYESTGHTEEYPDSRSLFGVVDLKTGKIQPKVELDKNKFFGEGISFLNGKVYQLTYTEKIGFIYDARTFKKIGEFGFPSKEGWGMTTDGSYLIMSDGSSNISYLDPSNFRLVKIVGVNDINGYANNINELEFIDGYIYANQYQTNNILKIDPESGKILGKANFDNLKTEVKNKYSGAIDMNGIAYDSATRKIYITGKKWPTIYEIKFNN